MNVPKLRFKEFDGKVQYEKTERFFKHIRNGFVGTATPYYTDSSGIKYLQSNNIKDGQINEKNIVYINEEFHKKHEKNTLKIGDLLVVQSGHAGDCAVVNEKYINCNCHALIIMTPNSQDEINTEFLNVYMHTSKGKKELNKLITGNTIKHILASDMKKFNFPNLQIEEQKKIAAFFKILDKKIQLQQQKIDLLQEQKKGYQFKLLNNPDWKEIRLGDYAEIRGRLGWKGLKQEEYVEKGAYLIAGKHITRGNIFWDKCDQITIERYEESIEIALKENDIIFSKDGSLGNPAFIKCMPGKATINSTMMLVRVSEKDKLDSKFVYHILNSNIFRKLIHLKVSGSSIPHLFQADMKEFTFSVPSDIRTQKKISHIFDIIDKEIDLAYKKLDLLKLQKQGFMQQMFI